jgi:putative nucleotidyltransferase with HDIG domain
MVLVFNKMKKQTSSLKSGNDKMETEEYQTRIALLTEIAEETSSITEVSTLLERILKVTQHSLGTTVTTLFLNDEKKAELYSPFSVRNFEGAPHRRATALEIKVAKWVASNANPVIVNDIEADNRFNSETTDSSVRAIIAAPIRRGEKVIGVISSINKQDESYFTEGDFEILKGFASTEALILLVSMQITAIENYRQLALNKDLLDGYRSSPKAPTDTDDIENSFGYAHSRRCRDYALLAANCLGLSSQEVKAIEFGALLHDIGKIGIGAEILRKPGPLTDDEWKIMYEHPRKGADILGEIPYLKEARDIVLYHHERYDGKGYPEKLAGEDIPLGARIVAVANAFDAMTTDRSYRAALPADAAIAELVHNMGTQFCPRATEAFISAFKKREDQLPLEKETEDLKEKTNVETTQLTTQVNLNDPNITIEEEREARAQKARAEQEAREQQDRAEKEAREQLIRAEKEAREREKAEREAREQQEKAAREERARAEEEVKKREKAEREAREQQEKAAREEQARAEKEVEKREKAEREAREQQEKAAREAQAEAEKEAEKREKTEWEAEEQRIKAEKEAAREAQAEAEKEAEEREKAEREAQEQRIKAEEEAAPEAQAEAEKETKEHEKTEPEDIDEKFRQWQARVEKEAIREAQAKAKEEAIELEKAEQESRELQAIAEEKTAREEQARAEREAKEREKAEQEAREWQAKAEKEARKTKKQATQKRNNGNIDKEKSHGDIRLVVPITADIVEVRKFRKELERLEGLRIVLFGSSEEDGHIFVLSLPEPMLLMHAVNEIALVESVGKKGKDILVTLKDGGNQNPEEED